MGAPIRWRSADVFPIKQRFIRAGPLIFIRDNLSWLALSLGGCRRRPLIPVLFKNPQMGGNLLEIRPGVAPRWATKWANSKEIKPPPIRKSWRTLFCHCPRMLVEATAFLMVARVKAFADDRLTCRVYFLSSG
jgi:hypothetical protein